MRLFPLCVLFAILAAPAFAEDFPDLKSVPEDLVIPEIENGPPAAGKRVAQTTPGWENSAVHGVLYLPVNWHPGGRYPVLAEYAGNGGYKNQYGDESNGTVEGSRLGYGLSAGQDYIWICLPYVQLTPEGKSNATLWWGDADETAAYCVATMHWLEREFGADPQALVLCGFSRGSIGCNFIGLRNDEIAGLWRAFFCHSNYDGVRTTWPYPGADRASALSRLARLHGRPQFISHEESIEPTRRFLEEAGAAENCRFEPLPFRNHSDRWALRDCGVRRAARQWLRSLNLPSLE